jgi:outer membrane protein OmpA-like peptidoglycan-associated protein
MWKYKLIAKGRIFSNETNMILPGTNVTLNNLTDGKVDEVVVNENGEYAFKVIPNRKYRIEAEKEGFIPSGFDLDTKGIMEGELLNDIVLEEVYAQKEVVFFEFDKANISSEFKELLDHIVRTMRKFSESTVFIGAHADARGTYEYNKDLSERRASATKTYLVKQGISVERIESVGFGEELILNRCSDGVICDEDEHARNRRAEVKVQNIVETLKPVSE